jgi:hypothetical protein
MVFLLMSVLFRGAKKDHLKHRCLYDYVLCPSGPRLSTHLSTFLSLSPSFSKMVKASLSFPPPADAASVTGEQTQARLEEFRQLPWLEPDWEDATRNALQVVERYWHSYVLLPLPFSSPGSSFKASTDKPFTHHRRYCTKIDINYKQALLCEEAAMYMNFIDWMYKYSKRKKKQTYDMYWRRLCLYFSLFAEREMSNNVMKQMRRVRKIFQNITRLSITNILVYQYSPTSGR